MEASNTKAEQVHLAAFQQLRNGKLRPLWDTIVLQESVLEMMSKCQEVLGIDLTEAADWFETGENPLDPADYLSEDLTYKAFCRRLGNFLLSKAYEHTTDPSHTIEAYLQIHWGSTPPTDLPVPDIPQSNSWVNGLVRAHAAELYKHYVKAPVTPQQSKHLLRTLLTVCELAVPEAAVKDYYKQADKRNDAPMTFSEFIQSVEQWADTHSELQSKFRNMLALTRLEFASLTVTEQLQPVLKELNKTLATVAAANVRGADKDLAAAQMRGITEVFSFYAKARAGFGPKATFEQIESNNTSWDVAKFMKFCTDFGLVKNPKLLNKGKLIEIFKKCATNAISMSLVQFTEALDSIAACYYSKEYDALFNTAHAHKPTLQKRELLYALLKFHRPNSYLKKVKGFGFAFSKGKVAARIEPNDATRQYEFKVIPKLRRDIEDWLSRNSQPKVQKTPTLPAPLVKHSTPAPRRVARVVSKSSFKYSQRPHYRPKADSKPSQSEVTADILSSKPVSLKELSAMKYVGKPVDFLADDEETDSYLKKLHTYSKKPQDLSYVLRMQDQKINRGLRALHRHPHN